jgi:type I restriction enzyme S subunit
MKWELKSFDEIGFIGRGKSRHRPRNAEHLYGGEYPFVQTGDIKAANFRINEYSQTYNEAGLAQSKLWKEGTLCITIAANIADTAILGIDACFPDSVIGFVPYEDKSDVRFVKYFFDIFQARMKSISTGAAQDNLSLEKLLTFKIPTPPLPTQRKIASILSAYDDLIENNLKRIKLLEEKAFASYKLIVQNEKLEEFTIEELANVVMGQSPTSDTYTNEKEDNLPFHQGVSNFSNYFVEHKIFCKAPIKIAEEGDILFSVRAPVGRINFTSDKICIGRGLCAFRSKNGFQNYFYHQLKEFFFAEDVIGNGAIFNAVTKVELMKVKLKTPSEKIQQEFELEAQQMFNLILNLTKQNTKLREARDILLPKLMNGQIEV